MARRGCSSPAEGASDMDHPARIEGNQVTGMRAAASDWFGARGLLHLLSAIRHISAAKGFSPSPASRGFLFQEHSTWMLRALHPLELRMLGLTRARGRVERSRFLVRSLRYV